MEYVPKFLHYLGDGKLQINIRILICQVLMVISIETRDRLKKRKKSRIIHLNSNISVIILNIIR